MAEPLDDPLARQDLGRLAPTVDAPASRALFERRRRDRRRRRRIGTAAASALGAACVAGGTVAVVRATAGGDDRPVVVQAGPTAGAPTTAAATALPLPPSTVVPSPPATAPSAPPPVSSAPVAQHGDGEWRDIANGPLGFRTEPMSTWTGRELLVWGGVDGPRVLGDGAAYDPASDTWRMLAPAPMGRYGARSAWTGREWLLVGGVSDRSADPDRGGLGYDPVADTWRTLPTAPFDPYAVAWTGTELLAVDVHGTAVAAYSPILDTWRTVATLPASTRGDTEPATIVVDGTTATVFRTWEHTVVVGPHSSESTAGVETVTVGLATGDVTVGPTSEPGQGPVTVDDVVAADHRLVALRTSFCAPGWSCPVPVSPGLGWYDPVTAAWHLASAAPERFTTGRPVWTGAVVIVAGTGGTVTGGPYPTLAWDPGTDTWTELPAAPAQSFVVEEWADGELLTWGEIGADGRSTAGHAFRPPGA